MKPAPGNAAFSRLEICTLVLVGAALLVTLPLFAAGTMEKNELTKTLNNARQLEIAAQMMALDNTQAGSGVVWTTVLDKDGHPRPATLEEFYGALTSNNYLTAQDLRTLLTAPGIGPGEKNPTAGTSCFKFFWVQESSPEDQPLLVTANWTPKGLDPKAAPFGDKAFIVGTKGGAFIASVNAGEAAASNTKLFPADDAKKGYSTTVLK